MILETLYNSNPFGGCGLGDSFKKKENKTTYYFLPKFLNKLDKDEWVACFRLSTRLIDGIDKQVYYDLVYLGLTSITNRPHCCYCGKEAKFSFEVSNKHGKQEGYQEYCANCRYVHIGKLNRETFSGISLSKETREKFSIAKLGSTWSKKRRIAYVTMKQQGKLHFSHSEETKQKLSVSKKGKVQSRSYYKSGEFRSKNKKILDPSLNGIIKFLSSYEEYFLFFCDSSNQVSEISVPDPIAYKKSYGSLHHYYPDFLITLCNGYKLIVEIKAANLANTDEVIRKKIAAIKYTRRLRSESQTKISYVLLTEKDLFLGSPRNHKLNVSLNLIQYSSL